MTTHTGYSESTSWRYVGWKDSEFKHEGCNQNLADILGLNNPQEIIGLTDDYFHPYDANLVSFIGKMMS